MTRWQIYRGVWQKWVIQYVSCQLYLKLGWEERILLSTLSCLLSRKWQGNSMKQSCSLEAKSSSACQEIPSILWNPNVHCNVHYTLLSGSVLSHNNLIHAVPFFYFEINFNIIIQFMLSHVKPTTPEGRRIHHEGTEAQPLTHRRSGKPTSLQKSEWHEPLP